MENKYYQNIQEDLDKYGYKNIKPYIPIVRVLDRSRNGKDSFTETPLLFNYGFMRMSSERAYNRYFLRELKKKIPGIRSWVRSLESIHPKRLRKRIDSEEFDDFSKVAIITRKEVKRLFRIAKRNSIYSKEELTKLHKGDYVILRCYPYEGISAQVENVNIIHKTIKLNLCTEMGSDISVNLPFDNVFYSVYSDYNPEISLSSELEPDMNKITEESIQTVLDIKQK